MIKTDLFFFKACSSELHVADLSVFVLDLEWFCFRFVCVRLGMLEKNKVFYFFSLSHIKVLGFNI